LLAVVLVTKRYYILRLNKGQIYAQKIGREFGLLIEAEEWLAQHGNRFDYVGERYTKTKKGKL
jgi:hypothetical protein